MTPAERDALVQRLVAEVRPDIQRLIRNYQSTLGRPITDEELADFDLGARVINQIGEDLLRLKAGQARYRRQRGSRRHRGDVGLD